MQSLLASAKSCSCGRSPSTRLSWTCSCRSRGEGGSGLALGGSCSRDSKNGSWGQACLNAAKPRPRASARRIRIAPGEMCPATSASKVDGSSLAVAASTEIASAYAAGVIPARPVGRSSSVVHRLG